MTFSYGMDMTLQATTKKLFSGWIVNGSCALSHPMGGGWLLPGDQWPEGVSRVAREL